MTAQILDGKATAAEVKADLKERVAALAAQGIAPGLGTILVGDDPGSRSYVAGKHRDCAQVGIASIRRDLPASASQRELVRLARGRWPIEQQYRGYLSSSKSDCAELTFAANVAGVHSSVPNRSVAQAFLPVGKLFRTPLETVAQREKYLIIVLNLSEEKVDASS